MPVALGSPIYRLGDGWAGNVVDDYDVEWIVEDEDGWSSSPPVRPNQADKAAADGAWSGPGLYGARVVALSGRAKAPDRAGMLAAKDRLKAAIGPRTPVLLTVEEEHLTRVAQVRLTDQIEVQDQTASIFSWSLTLTAPDPRRYAAEPVTVSTLLPTGMDAGRTYSRTYDLSYGGTMPDAGAVFIVQAGDYDQTPAVIAIVGPVVGPRVEHVQTGRYLHFDMTVEWGEELVIDLAKQTAMLGGHSSRAHTLTSGSAWFWLVPGENELLFRGSPGTTPDGSPPEPQMTVTAASAWT